MYKFCEEAIWLAYVLAKKQPAGKPYRLTSLNFFD